MPDAILTWGGKLAVAGDTYVSPLLYAAALKGNIAEARAAAKRRGVYLAPHHHPTITPVGAAVLLSHPTTGAPMLVPQAEAEEKGIAAAGRPVMQVTLAWYRDGQHPVRKCVQAKHLTYAALYDAVDRAQGRSSWAWTPDVLAQLPEFPPYVVHAKVEHAIRKGIMRGDADRHSRGDWEVVRSESARLRVSELDEAVRRSSL